MLFMNMKLTNWRVFAALALTFSSAAVMAHDYKAGELHIEHPWARPTLTAVVPAAVYFEIANHGAADDRLISASTGRADHVELHASIKDAETGSVKMRVAKDGIATRVGETLSMETGSYHIMLIGLGEPLKEGESFPMRLTFEKAGEVEIMINVEDREAKASNHHTGH